MNSTTGWVFIFTLFSILPAWAASVSGLISDPTRRPVPNARVLLLARGAPDRLPGFSNESGRYRFDAVAPGDYLVEAEAEGFAGSGARPLAVGPEGAQLDLQLGVAALRSEILVTANGTA